MACSSKPSNSQWVFFTGTSYTELIVVEVVPGLVILLVIHSHLPLASLCQTMNCFKTIPEVLIEVSKSCFILNLVLIKVHCTILPVSLYHSPSSISSVHVTVDISSYYCIERRCTSTICHHLVDSRRCFTECKASKVTATVSSYQIWTAFGLECVVLFEEVITVLISIDQ